MTTEPIIVACGDNDLSGHGVWSVCACGARIVHDPRMQARIEATHPGQPIMFECLACTAGRTDIDMDQVLQGSREVTAPLLPEGFRGRKLTKKQLLEFLRSYRRN